VKVKVVETDVKRQRIALTMRLDDDFPAEGSPAQQPQRGAQDRRGGAGGGGSARDVRSNNGGKREPEAASAMAAAFAKLKK
jgi:protein Tex